MECLRWNRNPFWLRTMSLVTPGLMTKDMAAHDNLLWRGCSFPYRTSSLPPPLWLENNIDDCHPLPPPNASSRTKSLSRKTNYFSIGIETFATSNYQRNTLAHSIAHAKGNERRITEKDSTGMIIFLLLLRMSYSESINKPFGNAIIIL